MAQVTLSGKYGFGFASDKLGNAAATTGLQTTDGNLKFAASEDLGGGLKAMAAISFDAKGRGGDPASTDASLTLAGGFGTLTMGSVESGNPVNAYAGSDGRGLDDTTTKVIRSAGNVELVKYTLPTMVSGLTIAVAKTDPVGAGTVGASNTKGFTVGYAAGPVSVGFGLTDYKDASGFKNRTTIGGSYDLGVVKLSAGFQTYKYVVAGTPNRKETVMGVSAPVASNMSVGLTYAKAKQDGLVNAKGYDLGATYSLSKRTSVNFSYASVTPATGAAKNKFTRVKMVHAF